MNNHTLPSGHLLANRYKIEKVLGQGGFGITYKAQHDVLGGFVCIKELFMGDICSRNGVEVSSSDGNQKKFKSFVGKFIEEAKNLNRFNHNNIVKVQDVFEENNTAYMVMEFVEGKTLKQFVDERALLKLEEVSPIVNQLLDAVEEVHKAGMLHRDIKPENILIDKNSRIVLVDFGSAKEFEEEKTSIQGNSTYIVLSYNYAPPEQFTTQKRGVFSDIYSLGGTLYYLLTKTTPLSYTERAQEEIKSPRQLNSSISIPFSNAILKALNPKIEERFQSIEEFREIIFFEFGAVIKKYYKNIFVLIGAFISLIVFKYQPLFAFSKKITAIIYLCFGIILVFFYIISLIDLKKFISNDKDDKSSGKLILSVIWILAITMLVYVVLYLIGKTKASESIHLIKSLIMLTLLAKAALSMSFLFNIKNKYSAFLKIFSFTLMSITIYNIFGLTLKKGLPQFDIANISIQLIPIIILGFLFYIKYPKLKHKLPHE